jgi:hypothetical protein
MMAIVKDARRSRDFVTGDGIVSRAVLKTVSKVTAKRYGSTNCFGLSGSVTMMLAALPALRFDRADQRFLGIGKLDLCFGQRRGERGNRRTRPLLCCS